MISQLAKEFPVFYELRIFITEFTLELTLLWGGLIQPLPFYRISLRSTLILSSYLYLCLPNSILTFGFSKKIKKGNPLCIFLPSLPGTFSSHCVLLGFVAPLIFGEQYKSWKFLTVKFSPAFFHIHMSMKLKCTKIPCFIFHEIHTQF